MKQDLFIWNNAQDFATGQQQNVCVADSALTLCNPDSTCAPSGYYTTPETMCAPFSALVASWNSDTPPETSIEVFARVRVQGSWSAWLSYGQWSPFLATRGSTVCDTQHPAVQMHADTGSVTCAGADAFQLRVLLTASPLAHGAARYSPVVRLLAASVRLMRPDVDCGEPLTRCVPVPCYSHSIRYPQIAHAMSSATAITMLLNRFGEDVLPEEVALACFDTTTNRFDNASFSTALAGCYGYECFVRFADVATLKQEIKRGFGCAVSMRSTDSTATALLPKHFLVVRGFETDETGVELVLVNDSRVNCDSAAAQRIPMQAFEAAWSGIAYVLHAKHSCGTLCPPHRVTVGLPRAELPCEYALTICGERRSLPTHFIQKNNVCTGCVCYALHEAHAHASTAHKCFFYGNVSPSGNIVLNSEIAADTGMHFSVFIIGNAGITYAAEITLKADE